MQTTDCRINIIPEVLYIFSGKNEEEVISFIHKMKLSQLKHIMWKIDLPPVNKKSNVIAIYNAYRYSKGLINFDEFVKILIDNNVNPQFIKP